MLAFKKFDLCSHYLSVLRKSLKFKWSRTLMTKTKNKGFNARLGDDNQGGELQYLIVNSSLNRWEDVPYGVAMDVGYYDTVKNVNNLSSHLTKSFKIIMALHDTPGTHSDVMPLLQPFELRGYRVIAPNFPGNGITNAIEKIGNSIFTHSTDEKVELTVGLLNNLSVENVDILVACGSSADVALSMASSKSLGIKIKALVLIDPWPHKMFKILGTNSFFYTRIPSICDYKTLRYLSWPALHLLKSSIDLKFRNVRDFLTFCYTVSEIDYKTVRGNIKATTVRNIPRLIVFSEDESFIEKDVLKEYIEGHGMKLESGTILDSEGQLIKKGSQDLNQNVLIKCRHTDLLPNFTNELNGLIHNFSENVNKLE